MPSPPPISHTRSTLMVEDPKVHFQVQKVHFFKVLHSIKNSTTGLHYLSTIVCGISTLASTIDHTNQKPVIAHCYPVVVHYNSIVKSFKYLAITTHTDPFLERQQANYPTIVGNKSY